MRHFDGFVESAVTFIMIMTTCFFCLLGYWSFLDTQNAFVIRFNHFETAIVQPGHDLVPYFDVDILRACKIDVRRYALSSEHGDKLDRDAIFLNSQEKRTKAEDIGNTLTFKIPVPIATNMKPGTYWLYIESDVKCNPIQERIPMHIRIQKQQFTVQ